MARINAVSEVVCRIFTSALLFVPCLAAVAQQKPERAIDFQRPLQVDLLTPLDVGKLSPGSHIFAKTRVEWSNATCRIRAGAAVSGHAVEVVRHTKENKGSSVTVLFDTVSCDGHTAHILFNLFAVIAVVEIHEGTALADFGTFGAASTAPHMGGGGGGGAHAAVPLSASQDIAVTNAGKPLELPAVIQPGQVFGQKNLFLAVGTGLDGGSTLSSPKGNFRVEAGAQFVLMPKPVLSPETVAAVASMKAPSTAPEPPKSLEPAKYAPPPPPPKPEIDETDVCSSLCNVVSSSDGDPAPTKANSTLSIDRFGYLPHERGEYKVLNHDATLTFLDANNLLFTFDLHKLRHRYPDGIRTEFMRTIRAVLVDPSTYHVKRILDWQVQGEGQYLWAVRRGVLIHVGHTLNLMNSHLDLIQSVKIPGQLAFVSLSPDDERMAVGTLHERHTGELHDALTLALHVEPEEDVDVQLFDGSFKLLFTSYQSDSLPPPILSNDGEIRVHSMGHNHWRINEYTWNRTNRTVANIQSMCRPDISTPLPHTIFVVGCTVSPLQNWYRMLRSDGHPILLGRGSSREIGQACSSRNDQQFAVRVVHTEHTKENGEFFHKSDLLTQEISIYRASDGKRLFETTADSSLVEQSFASSPSGKQLAILTDGGISFYMMP